MLFYYGVVLFPTFILFLIQSKYSLFETMVTASHQCCKECRFLYNHTYSTKKDIIVDGSFINDSYIPTKKYKICNKL